MAKVCPSCGTNSTGKFCSQCGTALDAAVCASCGNTIPEGGRFCNMCGTPVAAAVGKGGGKRAKGRAAAAAVPVASAGAGASRNLPWIVAGAAVVALAVVLVMSMGDSEPEAPFAAAPAAGPAAPAVGGPSAVDLSSMTPRQAADRLFNRVMTAVSGGDTAQARAFAPMAVSAYGMVADLDLDGRYHVAVIQLVNNQPTEALATANLILAEVPTHLFGHFTAAEAEQMLGNEEAAAAHYRQFLDNFDAELATGRVEYEEHEPVLPGMREQATQILAGA